MCGSVFLCVDISWAVFELEVTCLIMCEYVRLQCFCMSYRRRLFLTCSTHYCILPHGSLSRAVRLRLAMILSFCSSSCLLIYVLPLFLLPFLSLTPLRFTLLVLDALIKPACGLFDAVLMTFYVGVFSPRASVRLALLPPLT